MSTTEKTLCDRDHQEISDLLSRNITAIYVEKQNKGLYLEFETTDEEEHSLYLYIYAASGVCNSYVEIFCGKRHEIFPEYDYTPHEKGVDGLDDLIGHSLVGVMPDGDGLILHFHKGSFHQTLKLEPWLEAFGSKTNGNRTMMKGMRPVLVATKTGKPFPQH